MPALRPPARCRADEQGRKENDAEECQHICWCRAPDHLRCKSGDLFEWPDEWVSYVDHVLTNPCWRYLEWNCDSKPEEQRCCEYGTEM